MSNKLGNTVTALLIGTAIGAVAGILLAPDKGSKTREKIKKGFDEAKDELKNQFENVSEEVKSKFSDTFGLEETYEHLISKMSHKTEDAITYLESKLAELKEQNAKLQK